MGKKGVKEKGFEGGRSQHRVRPKNGGSKEIIKDFEKSPGKKKKKKRQN